MAVLLFAVGDAAERAELLELPNDHHVPVATQRDGRSRVQRVWPLLQVARHQPAPHHEEGQYSGTALILTRREGSLIFVPPIAVEEAQAKEQQRRPTNQGVRAPRRPGLKTGRSCLERYAYLKNVIAT